MDWGLHGWKRLVSNFLVSLYKSWAAKLNNKARFEEQAEFEHQMRMHVTSKYQETNTTFKLGMLDHIMQPRKAKVANGHKAYLTKLQVLAKVQVFHRVGCMFHSNC